MPVLVLRGTGDTIMSESDSRTLADIVNRKHPGNARYVEIKNADHLLSVNDKLDDNVIPVMLDWLRENAK